MQRGRRHPVAGRDAAGGADHAQRRALQQYLPQQMAARHARHPQQRKLAAAAQHRQRLAGKHQKRAGKQRDQRQHIQVDAVSARHIGGARLLIGGLERQRAALQFAVQCGLEGGAIDAVGQLQLDARQLADAPEAPLRGADVHHRDALSGARPQQAARHPQTDGAAARAQRN